MPSEVILKLNFSTAIIFIVPSEVRKFISNFLSLSYFFFNFGLLFFSKTLKNFLIITLCSMSSLIQIFSNLKHRTETFWAEFCFIWQWTDIHGFVIYSWYLIQMSNFSPKSKNSIKSMKTLAFHYMVKS